MDHGNIWYHAYTSSLIKKKKHEPLFDLYESRVLNLTSIQKIFPFFHYLNYKTKSEMAIQYATLQSFGRFDNCCPFLVCRFLKKKYNLN